MNIYPASGRHTAVPARRTGYGEHLHLTHPTTRR
jgi:hypothetical protein